MGGLRRASQVRLAFQLRLRAAFTWGRAASGSLIHLADIWRAASNRAARRTMSVVGLPLEPVLVAAATSVLVGEGWED